MKISFKLSRIIVICIAALFIIYGLVQVAFKINIDKSLENNISLGLMIVAAYLIFSVKRPEKDKEGSEDKKE